jgi:hypothetical protein
MATEETRPPYDDLAAIVREIAEGDPLVVSDHAPGCLYIRCCALAARLPPA